jgi:2'-5' RNA ligase
MRLFIALPLPDDLERRLGGLIDDLRARGGNVRWVPAGNIHLTVRFLGETDPALVDRLSAEIDKVAGRYQQLEAVADRLGAFPNLRRPRVLWVGLTEATGGLKLLARDMEKAVHKFGFKAEKKGFKAHLTLGRVRDQRDIKPLVDHVAALKFEPAPFVLDRLVLFESTLTPKGAIYKRLHEAPLGTSTFEG